MKRIDYTKKKHELKIEYIERIPKSVSESYSATIEYHLCSEKDGCIYYISLTDSQFVYWKIAEDGSLKEVELSLIEYNEDWSIEYLIDKIYLNNTLIWDINNFELKAYLWYSAHDKVKKMDVSITSHLLIPNLFIGK